MNFCLCLQEAFGLQSWEGQMTWPEAERKEIRIRYFSLKPRDIGSVVNEHYVDTYQM